jgi:murein DD-endopeptidase MepM/ murein hydrolase activator NlpD
MLVLRFTLLALTVAATTALPHSVLADNLYGSYSDKRVAGPTMIPLTFPVAGKATWSDTFAPNGEGGKRSHHGLDLMAPKMTPLVAAFDGQVELRRASKPGGANMLWLRSDEGIVAVYIHINNDTPGTDDGLGSDEYAFAPGLQTGDHVTAGQHIAYVGDSGNAENVGPHCHFELYGPDGWINPTPSLLLAQSESDDGVENHEVARAIASRQSRRAFAVRGLSTRGAAAGSSRLAAVRTSLCRRKSTSSLAKSTKRVRSKRVRIASAR